MSSSVTVALLDSMLSPTPGQAEAHYNSVPLPDRVRETTSLLNQFCNSSGGDDASAVAGRAQLAAVLLRRDISSSCAALASGECLSLLGEVAEPLMEMFVAARATDEKTRRQVGHCVAELCSSLSVVSAKHGREWMASVLGRLGPGCAASDVTYLRLLADIADRSPTTLWSVGTTDNLSGLFRNDGQSSYATLDQLEASVGALTAVGIAYEKAKRVASSDGRGDKNEVEKALLAQFSDGCTDVDANSAPSRLGEAFLPPMLSSLVGHSQKIGSNPRGAAEEVEVLSKCVSDLATCANQCPSMLAGDGGALEALLRACMSIARLPNETNDEGVTFLRLSALDVFATLTAVPSIKRSIMKPTSAGPSPSSVVQGVQEDGGGSSPLLRFLLDGADGGQGGEGRGVLYQCASLAVAGVDGDEGAWAEDHAQVYDTENSWDDDKSALHAESLLESFVENLGGRSTLPVVFRMVDALLASSNDWRNQRAVLSILERCLAAAPVTFVPHVAAAVDVALRSIGTTSSVRVQYQALQLLGSLCCANSVDDEDGAAAGASSNDKILVRETYGPQILDAVSRLIGSPCSKVASHACLTVVSYCRGGNGSENCLVPIDKNLIVPYVGGLLDALRSGPLAVNASDPNSVDEGSLTVLLRGIGAVACLADASGEDFLPHYGVMGGLTSCALFGLVKSGDVIQLAPGVTNTHEMATLRGSAIEAASIIGAAIAGPDGENVSTYVNDASEIMSIATALLKNSDNASEVIIPMDQLLAACARIAAVMKSQYVQFMPSVLPHILKRATEKVDVSITDDENVGSNPNGDSEDGYSVSIPGMGSKKVKINTTQLEEKAQSARAIYEHARALGKEFGPFVEASATAFLPLVHCEYSGDVRSTSAQALCQIFKAACLSAAEADAANNAMGPAQTLLPLLTKALTKQLSDENDDDDIENRFAMADALSEVMWDANTHKAQNGQRVAQINVTDARELTSCLMSLISACLSRRSTLFSEMAEYSFDNDEVARCEERANAESEYLTHLVDSVGYQLKSLGQSFTPIFAESVAGPLGQALTATGTKLDNKARLSAICLFDDCVEHCGSAAASTYAPALLEGIKEALDDKAVQNEHDMELKRAAAYGIAQISRHAPKALTADVGQALLAKLYDIAKEVETVSKGDIEHISLVENAVSAIASLSLFPASPLFNSVQEKGALVNVFLCCLPLEQDFDEAKICHDGMCDLVDANIINVQSQYKQLLAIIGKILSFVSDGDGVATESTCSRLMGIINTIQQTVDGNSIQAAFGELDGEAQGALIAAMQ